MSPPAAGCRLQVRQAAPAYCSLERSCVAAWKPSSPAYGRRRRHPVPDAKTAMSKKTARPCISADAAAAQSPPAAKQGTITYSPEGRSYTGTPGPAAQIDVYLTPEKSVQTAQQVIDMLMKRGVCVIRAGADRTFQKALYIESKLLWDMGEFGEAKKATPITPGSDQMQFSARDDKVLWMKKEWMEQNAKKCKALKVLDSQLADFGWGLNKLLEEQLGLSLKQRTTGMLSCYCGSDTPGARYDFHIDNPYQTTMKCPDDKRRLTLIYYISEGKWDVMKDGGGLQVALTNPRRAPHTTSEAVEAEMFTVAPECDTMVLFFSHTMFHAVLPVKSPRHRFALSTWFQCP
eukprot:gnl/TRDRNA2_/TRDRNA2_86092_c0_seq2.p1 gnl/TRDRNA2_/TRDRNA2_86092_c0~~gnl/TRDRNA2_/TRDRNA2_86092_c0_seq2.p1  ORF type:complete len:346 (+),score=77.83 gnl/TRDRNA2_/TRDRNA2_86092_c0_seq2:232-1269(+)